MSLMDKLRSGISGARAAMEAGTFVVNGHEIKCVQCGNKSFERGAAQLNTAVLTFLDLDWANTSAYILSCMTCKTCKTCSHIMWFLKEPGRN